MYLQSEGGLRTQRGRCAEKDGGFIYARAARRNHIRGLIIKTILLRRVLRQINGLSVVCSMIRPKLMSVYVELTVSLDPQRHQKKTVNQRPGLRRPDSATAIKRSVGAMTPPAI